MNHQSLLDNAISKRSQLKKKIVGRMPSYLASKIDASDIVQETLLDIILMGERTPVVVEDKKDSWLLSALCNNLLDGYRRFVGTQKRCAFRENGGMQSLESLSAGAASSCEAANLRKEERKYVLSAVLNRLPIEYRTVLELHFLQGMPYSQIGQLVNRSEDAVRMLSNRALKAALGILNNDGYTSPSL